MDEYCRERALAEPLAGTANEAVQRWILLEDGGPWGAKVPRETTLPQPVIDWLDRLAEQPGARVQLIRRPRTSAGKPTRSLIVVDAHERPELRRMLELEVEVDELPELDLDARMAALAPSEVRSLWLVCTHGARDRCCAKWGVPVFEALYALAPATVWQCSHLGGHRFAPTFLLLPQGLSWGRVPIEEIVALWQGVEAGELPALDYLRGRACYSAAAQVGEIELRRRLGLRGLDALRLLDARPLAAGRTHLRFEVEGAVHELELEQRSAGLATAGSCGDTRLEPRTTLVVV